MAHTIPYSTAKYQVEDGLIPGNSTSETPVIFHLAPAQGPDKARLRSTLYATAALSTNELSWTAEVQDAVIASFGRGAELFVRCVDKVDNLTVPGAMAKRAGLIPPDKWEGIPDEAKVPVRSGSDFALVSGYIVALSFAVAMEIAKISNELERLDPRLFESPSGLPSAEAPGPTPGTAGRARKRRGRRGTAD